MLHAEVTDRELSFADKMSLQTLSWSFPVSTFVFGSE